MSALEELERRGPLKQKRVRFAEGEEEEERQDGQKGKKPLFPKGKKRKDDDGIDIDAVDAGGAMPAKDPRAAATERAERRKKRLAEKKDTDDTSMLDDVMYAEEEYEDDEGDEMGLVKDEEGIKMEPFNLKKEREEGFFDAEGNYVEYRVEQEATDAWLETAQVDPRLAAKAAAEQQEADDEGKSELSTADLGAIKRRIADTLQPGETVLRALRRLGGNPKAGGGRGKGRGGKGRGETEEGHRMSDADKAMFDQLTEDASRLMDLGEYGVYEDKKETFQREAEGYEALARARAQMTDSSPADDEMDIFGDPNDSAPGPSGQPGAATSAGKKRSAEDMEGGAGGENGQNKEQKTSAEDGPQRGQSAGDGGQEASGYVYDSTSGYYYNQETGYYYEPTSGLYCSAETGQWFAYDAVTGEYATVPASEEPQADTGAEAERAARAVEAL